MDNAEEKEIPLEITITHPWKTAMIAVLVIMIISVWAALSAAQSADMKRCAEASPLPRLPADSAYFTMSTLGCTGYALVDNQIAIRTFAK